MTVDELAQQTGMTVRNIRAHQARGLLPPPEVRGRTAHYSQDHLDRVRLIMELQAEGLSLAAVKRSLDLLPVGAVGAALRLRTAVLRPFEPAHEVVSRADLEARFGEQSDDLLERAVAQGLLVELGDHYEVPEPELLDVAEQLQSLGVPLAESLVTQGEIARATDAIARVMVDLLTRSLWVPFAEGQDLDPSSWERLQATVEAAIPLATTATVASLRRSLARAVADLVATDLVGDTEQHTG